MERTMSRTRLLMSFLLVLGLGIFMSSKLNAATTESEEFHEGFEYYSLPKPQETQAKKGTVEVVELFWFGCPHCYRFEPVLSKWLKTKPENITFVRIPAIFPKWPGADIHARSYYTAVKLDVVDKVHQALFDFIQKNRRAVITQKQVQAIFVKAGVKAADFDKAFLSDDVNKMIAKGKKLTAGYGAKSVPLMIVAGKYKAGADLVDGSFPKLLRLVEFLVKKEMAATKK